jgi:hypothetical protein
MIFIKIQGNGPNCNVLALLSTWYNIYNNYNNYNKYIDLFFISSFFFIYKYNNYNYNLGQGRRQRYPYCPKYILC